MLSDTPAIERFFVRASLRLGPETIFINGSDLLNDPAIAGCFY
jgi:hypothetical protein